MIRVILNADDYGSSPIFNEAILELLESGHIRSTTVMVSRIGPAQKKQNDQLLTLIKENISVGLHIERPDHNTPQITEQLDIFRKIFRTDPSHLDIHKYTKDRELVSAMERLSKKLNIPVRNMGQVSKNKRTNEPCFSTLNKSFEEIKKYIDTLDSGDYEIFFHPGYFDPKSPSSYNKEREADTQNAIQTANYLETKRILNISYLDL